MGRPNIRQAFSHRRKYEICMVDISTNFIFVGQQSEEESGLTITFYYVIIV